MGNDESVDGTTISKVAPLYRTDSYMSITGIRNNEDRINKNYNTIQLQRTSKINHLIKSEFNGVWSTYFPERMPPESRHGHFTVEDKENRVVYIGDGMSKEMHYMFDLWAFELDKKEWHQIHLNGEILSPRVGVKAVLYNGVILAFGGYSDPRYFTDLHAINPKTGEVKRIQTTGEEPSARSTPIMHVIDNKLYLWGGFNGYFPNDLYVLDFQTMHWEKYPQNITGRTNVPSVVYNGHILSYGGSKNCGILDIDPSTKTVSIMQTSGAQPPSNAMGSGMTLIDDYLFFFGGKTQYSGSLVYACNLQKKWWFVFHVYPDNETVSLEDGIVTDIGLFLLPNLSSFTTFYDEKNRKIVSFLGEPHTFTHVVNEFEISEALAHLSLREDMCDVLYVHQQQ